MPSLQRVFEPIQIGSVIVPNRVARAANTTNVFTVGIDDQFVAYHRARARGGVGLTILEAASVHPTSILNYAVDDDVCRGYERLMRELKPYGMRVFQQLWHGGHHIPGIGGRLPWAASDVPSPFTGMVGLTMSRSDIAEMAAAFATAARRCRESGLDGIEIHGGHGYLMQQFFSPLTNTRTDEYGGSLQNRMRFALEVMRAVRAAVGYDFPVGIRISSSTAVGNFTAADLAQLAVTLVGERLVDFIDLSHGDYFDNERVTATMATPFAYEIEPNKPVLDAVTVPRLITGRFRTLEEIETVLRAGDADLVSMVRAHIADPDIVRKTRAGEIDRVRPCIACNQGCVGGLLQIGRFGCAVNPTAGVETLFDESQIELAPTPKQLLVIGGGPAGLEAARTAALRGHRVLLAEAGAALGGALRVAALAPRLQTLTDLADWLEREVRRCGVEIRTGWYVDADEIAKLGVDHVIVATGAASRRNARVALRPDASIVGAEHPLVRDAAELLLDRATDFRGRKAMVFDDVGHNEAVSAAEFLVERGAQVSYVTSCASFAPKLNGTGRNDVALQYLQRGSFEFAVAHRLVSFDGNCCVVQPLHGTATRSLAADCVVLVTAKSPRRDVYDALRGRGLGLDLIGDAASPRSLQEAIRDGHFAARAI